MVQLHDFIIAESLLWKVWKNKSRIFKLWRSLVLRMIKSSTQREIWNVASCKGENKNTWRYSVESSNCENRNCVTFRKIAAAKLNPLIQLRLSWRCRIFSSLWFVGDFCLLPSKFCVESFNMNVIRKDAIPTSQRTKFPFHEI